MWKVVRCVGFQTVCNKYATRISMICIGHFQRNLGMSFLCVTTSGATVSEYFEMMLASIEKYLLSGIARQRDMSKIALHLRMTAGTKFD